MLTIDTHIAMHVANNYTIGNDIKMICNIEYVSIYPIITNSIIITKSFLHRTCHSREW